MKKRMRIKKAFQLINSVEDLVSILNIDESIIRAYLEGGKLENEVEMNKYINSKLDIRAIFIIYDKNITTNSMANDVGTSLVYAATSNSNTTLDYWNKKAMETVRAQKGKEDWSKYDYYGLLKRGFKPYSLDLDKPKIAIMTPYHLYIAKDGIPVTIWLFDNRETVTSDKCDLDHRGNMTCYGIKFEKENEVK